MTIRFLKIFLLLDAMATVVLGLALLFASGPLAEPFGLSSGYLFWGGILCVVAVGILLYAASRPTPPAFALWEIVAINLGWVIASIAIFKIEYAALTGIGTIAILGTAAVILLAAMVQLAGARMVSRRSIAAAQSA